jgi:hypothetical protein
MRWTNRVFGEPEKQPIDADQAIVDADHSIIDADKWMIDADKWMIDADKWIAKLAQDSFVPVRSSFQRSNSSSRTAVSVCSSRYLTITGA